MKKPTIISMIFLSVQLFAQVNPTEKGSLLQLRNFERTSFSFEVKSQDSLPPISSGKIVAEFIGGNIIGLGLMFVGGAVGAGIGDIIKTKPADIYLPATLGFLLSYPFSVAYGVYVIGNIGVEEGSYWSTFQGALYGVGVGLSIAAIGSKVHDNSNLYGIAAFCPSVGAIIGFNSSRRLETNTSTFKLEQNKYSILQPDFSLQLLRVNF